VSEENKGPIQRFVEEKIEEGRNKLGAVPGQ
jgi:hypothetical protein